MDGDSNPGISADESNHEDPGLGQNLQGNCPEPVKEASGNNSVRCDICCCDVSSTAVLNSHMNGSRHRKRMKALEIVANLRALGPKGVDVGSKISSNSYRCDLCCLTVNSPQQLQVHLSGSKHKNKIAKEKSLKFSSMTNMKSVTAFEAPLTDSLGPPMKKRKKEEQAFICDLCNIVLNSVSQYAQHIYSEKHLTKLKGRKPNKKPAILGNESNLVVNVKQRQKSRGRKESSKGNWSVNASSIIQVHSLDERTNKNLSKSQSGCGNGTDCRKRKFLKNRQTGGDLFEVGKFHKKVESPVFKPEQWVSQASPWP